MIHFKAKKLWGGDVSVPSFYVEYAKKMEQKIRIEFENAFMVIDGNAPHTITAPTQIAQHTDSYIRKGDPYQLYDYKWNPQMVIPEYTNEGMKKLHEAMKEVFRKRDKQLSIKDTK